MKRFLAAVGVAVLFSTTIGQALPAVAASCTYVFTAPNGSPTLRTTAGTPVTLTYRLGDASYRTYDAPGGLILHVWAGMRDSEIATREQQMESEFPALAQQSFDESSTQDSTDDETNTVNEPTSSSLGTLVPFAVMLTHTGSGLAEYSVADSTEAWAVDQSSGVCVSGNSSAAKKVSTTRGASFEFPTKSSIASVRPNALPTTPRSAVRYRTFIGPSTISFPPLLCGWNFGGRFAGDGRGFSTYYSASNRTRASVFFDWATRKVTTSKHVGATKRLDDNGNIIEQKTASDAGIKFVSPIMSSSYGRIEIVHAVANPLCWAAGPVTYGVVIERWRGGGTRISGRRVPVPNHEAVVFPIGGTSGSFVFTRNSIGVTCLSAPCFAWESFRVSTKI